MDLTGYDTSNPVPTSCGDYGLSGEYVASDYIEKVFIDLGTDHYQTVVMIGIGYVGSWSTSDRISI